MFVGTCTAPPALLQPPPCLVATHVTYLSPSIAARVHQWQEYHVVYYNPLLDLPLAPAYSPLSHAACPFSWCTVFSSLQHVLHHSYV